MAHSEEQLAAKAADDFRQRTLAVLPTLLEKLAYICSLQTPRGTYNHWGMTRTFGHEPAQQALYTVHLEASRELVRSPLREIYRDYEEILQRSHALPPESLVLNAPLSAAEPLLSAHLRLLRDSVQAVALQEHSGPQAA
jgi:hypothetical protein